ncbi:hypothetical protein CL657_04100 [bacterium]|nr:hypothetical protein [bacterium]
MLHLIIVTFIISMVAIKTISINFNPIYTKLWTLQLITVLRYNQLNGYLQTSDSSVIILDNHIELSHTPSIVIPKSIKISCNRAQLGSKSNLNSKYPGTITLDYHNQNSKITSSPGLGFLNAYGLY